mgnify:CR=1 FL=1
MTSLTTMAESFEVYFNFKWFPVLIAFLSIILVWLWMQWRRKCDAAVLEEDQSLTEEIKASFNPDVLSTNSSVDYEREDGEKEIEMRIQQEQLKEIFQLMEKDKEKYGIGSIEDVEEQMKRYKT